MATNWGNEGKHLYGRFGILSFHLNCCIKEIQKIFDEHFKSSKLCYFWSAPFNKWPTVTVSFVFLKPSKSTKFRKPILSLTRR